MLFLLSLIFIVSAYDSDKIKKLSFDDTLTHLDTLVRSNTTDLDTQFDINSIEERSQFKDDLIQLLHQHQNQRSWFSRLTGLVTFKNILMILMTLVGVIFVVSLCKDMIIYLLTSKYLMYILGYGLSGLCFFKPQLIPLNIFEQFYPLFGLLLFSIVLLLTLIDIWKNYEDVCQIYPNFLVCLWTLASLYAQISFMGTLTIILAFYNVGSVIERGARSGFNRREELYNCFFLSICLNAIILHSKITQSSLHSFGVFETGIEFWGTLVGSLASLIVSTEFYLNSRYNAREKKDYFLKLWASKLSVATYCVFLMYTGTVFNINSYTNIGGTFFFFCALDIQYWILKEFKSQSITGVAFIVLINLYLLKELITCYPEYFLFM